MGFGWINCVHACLRGDALHGSRRPRRARAGRDGKHGPAPWRHATCSVPRAAALYHATALLGCGSEAVSHSHPAGLPVPWNGSTAPFRSRVPIVRRGIFVQIFSMQVYKRKILKKMYIFKFNFHFYILGINLIVW